MIVLLLAMAGGAGLWLPSFWETEWPTRAVLRTPSDTWFLDFSPDSRTLATWGGEGVTLWDVATGRERTTWKRADGQTAAMGVFAPDGRTFASLHSDYPGPITIDLIDVETGRSRASLPTQHNRIYGLVFTDEGRSLRAVLGDMSNLKQAVTWDVATGTETGSRTYTCLVGAADTMISPDGRLMALTPFSGKTVQIWDLETGQVISRLTHPSSSLRLAGGFAFSRDNRTLVTGREDGSFEVWDLATATLTTTFRGHTDGHVTYGLQLAPDGRTLASSGVYSNPTSMVRGLQLDLSRKILGTNWRPDPEVIVVDIVTGERLARAGSSMHPHYSPDGSTIATRQMNFSLRLRPMPGRKP